MVIKEEYQAISEKNEIEASSEALHQAIDDLKKEVEDLHKQLEAAWEERNVLEKALGEAKAKERLGEMNAALSEFSEEEQALAADEIEAFKADPINVEINSITDKIHIEIGKAQKAKEAEEKQHIAEQNSANDIEDIFSEVGIEEKDVEDISIF